MAFLKERRRRARVRKWRNLRKRLGQLETLIYDLELELMEYEPGDGAELHAHLQSARRSRNVTLRKLRQLENKEKIRVLQA